MKSLTSSICWRLGIGDPRYVEIESKMRVLPGEAKDLREHLMERRNVKHKKRTTFFDQFLDTDGLDLLKMGASLRLRYRGNGSHVYLQYKGPGFRRGGLLFRSEFSSEKLDDVVREESHHDIVHFSDPTVWRILSRYVSPAMAEAMRRHLGGRVIDAINTGPILCVYQKDKFLVDLGDAALEPSLDRLFAFHINRRGLHSLSTFWEFENEIKSSDGLEAKLDHVPELAKFNESLAKKFDLRAERLDKYHRLASCFIRLPHGRRPTFSRSR